MSKQLIVSPIYRLGLYKYIKSDTFQLQHILIVLLFVSATLIFLDLGLFSASFIFGLSLIVLSVDRTPWVFSVTGLMWFLFAFLVIALLSMLFSDFKLGLGDVKLYIQTIYWFVLANIVYKLYPLVNKKVLSKFVFASVLILLTLFVTGFQIGMTQNAVAFSVIILAPLSFYFIRNLWLKIGFAFLLVFLMLLNGSRSGAFISFSQSGLLILFSLAWFRKYIKVIIIAVVIAIPSLTTPSSLYFIGTKVYPINPRVGELLINTEFVLRNDMSWLQRKAQIQKGKQIFTENPIIGIGYTKFTEFDVVIDESKVESDRSLRNIDNRSSHNSYINWLSETGILGIGIMVMFFLSLVIIFWRNLDRISGTFESTLFISLIGMLIYFYTISAHLGTSTWIMYGIIAGGASYIDKSRRLVRLNYYQE